MKKKLVMPGELFRVALCEEIKRIGWGAQSSLADKIGMSRSHMNDIIKGRSAGPEEQRVRISEILGVNYEEMLAYGRFLLEGRGGGDESVRVLNYKEAKAPQVIDKVILLEQALDVVNSFYKEVVQEGFGSRSKSSVVAGFYREFLAKKNIEFHFDVGALEKAISVYDTYNPGTVLGINDLLSKGEWILAIYNNIMMESEQL